MIIYIIYIYYVYIGQTKIALLEGLRDYNPFPLEPFRKRPTGVCAVNFGPGTPFFLVFFNRGIIDRPTPVAQNALVNSIRG